ncbi:MAG: SUMF1/EgtB/PvdO family nonheme iron enzyme, partial [bacterium]|nr:SUMF1/EgtB/PvdO family nonheme iron enzyme [bacterium]
GPTNDPPGPASGNYRVLRGGDWGNSAGRLRVTNRGNDNPTTVSNAFGFRCARD